MRLVAKNFSLACKAEERFLEVARALWEQGLPLNAEALHLERLSEARYAVLTPVAKRLLAAWVHDQPLPGDLDARIDAGERFSFEKMFSEIEEAEEREDNRRFLNQVLPLI